LDRYLFYSAKTLQEAFFKKYAGNKTVENFIVNNKCEDELYTKYKQYYGYVFYIGKKYKRIIVYAAISYNLGGYAMYRRTLFIHPYIHLLAHVTHEVIQ
jgi:hypothetical protein